jgi:hypothetical protein
MTAIDFDRSRPLQPQPPAQPGPPEGGRAVSPGFAFAAIVTLLLAVVPAVLWPGDAYWMWDEPKLIGQALYYKQQHRIAWHGLSGNFSVPYGPFPMQCYQLVLLFTHDLVKITFIRALLSSSILAGSLLWLARSLRLTPWFAAAAVLGPFLVWTERTLWDATFAIPIGTLAVAAYASFLRTGSGKSLVTFVAAATLVPLIHMQGLPLFVALAGHALWRHRRELWKNWLGIGPALVVILLLNARYVLLFPALLLPRFSAPLLQGYPGRQTGAVYVIRSFFGPFLAGHNLTGENPVVPRTGLPGPASWPELAINVSLILYGFAWLGVAFCVVRLAWILRRRRRGGVPEGQAAVIPDAGQGNGEVLPYRSPDKSSRNRGHALPYDLTQARDAMVCICLAALLMQMLLAAALRVPGDPQYSFGTFPIHVLFAWAGVEVLRRVWLGLPATAVYGLAVGYLTIGGAISVHRYGWPRGILSPSINNQVAVAKQLNRFSDEAVWTDVTTYANFPRSIQVLRLLLPPEPGTVPVHSPHGLLVRYRPDKPANSQFIELIELPAPAFPPAPGIPDDSPNLARPKLPQGMVSGPPPLHKLDVTPAKPLW